mgnify:CR=1 FL=1
MTILRYFLPFLLFLFIINCASDNKERRGESLSKEAKVHSKRALKKRKIEKIKKETIEYDIYKGDEDIVIYGASKKKGKEEKVFTLFGTLKASTGSGAETGYSVSSGDINGDGTPDIIIGSPNTRAGDEDKNKGGKVYCLYGKNKMNDALSVNDSELILYNKSSSEKDWLGHTITAGDINGDGISDLLIGAPFMGEKSGAVFVIFGRDGISGEKDITEIADISIYGANKGDMAGYSIAIGDINKDGFADIIIGAPGSDKGRGEVYVISGGKSLEGEINLRDSYVLKIAGKEGSDRGFFVFNEKSEQRGDSFGYAVASCDINSDGISDVIIGAPGADGNNNKDDSGEIYVVYGKGGLKGELDLHRDIGVSISGAFAGDSAGYSITCGDINKDGISDVVIGSPNAGFKGGENRPGAVHIVYGKSKDEILRSAQNDSSRIKIDLGREAVAVINGKLGQEEKSGILSSSSRIPHYYFGYSLSAGDFNGDGKVDVAIGAPGAYALNSLSRRSAGEMYIVYGGDIKGEYEIEDFADNVIYGADEKDMAGTSLFMDDLNGDGISDLIIGAPGAKGEMKDVVNTGEVYIFYGNKE